MKSTLSRPIQLTTTYLSGRIGQQLGLSDSRLTSRDSKASLEFTPSQIYAPSSTGATERI